MTAAFLTCEEVITFLFAYLARELAPEREREFERHLGVCPSCVSYLKTYRTAVELGKVAMGGAEVEVLLPDLGRALTRAILDARRH